MPCLIAPSPLEPGRSMRIGGFVCHSRARSKAPARVGSIVEWSCGADTMDDLSARRKRRADGSTIGAPFHAPEVPPLGRSNPAERALLGLLPIYGRGGEQVARPQPLDSTMTEEGAVLSEKVASYDLVVAL